jgi:outer membrane receptor protein involved in Fe transport
VNERLQVRADGMLDDPQLTRTSNVFPALPDVGLPGVPYETGSVDVRYRWKVRNMEAAVSAQGAYVGRSYLSFAGEAASGMGGYATARVHGELTGPAWRLSAWIDNLTDVRADTFAFGNPFSRPLGRQSTPLRPRTLAVAVSRAF